MSKLRLSVSRKEFSQERHRGGARWLGRGQEREGEAEGWRLMIMYDYDYDDARKRYDGEVSEEGIVDVARNRPVWTSDGKKPQEAVYGPALAYVLSVVFWVRISEVMRGVC